MIKGDRIYLRLMEISDIPYKVAWINDEEVRKTLNFEFPISVISTEQWLRNICQKANRKDFIVCDVKTNIPIGYVGLLNIDLKNKKAESYLGIGNKEYWGKGYGYEIKFELLKYAFISLNLNKIYSYHHEDNYSMIKINEKLGGKIEGLFREDIFLPNGIVKNKVVMSILKREFFPIVNL
jgi:RimJ/RimL family protein N-acetyltransferase